MADYNNTLQFQLPSKGLIYDNCTNDGFITIRSMTTEEEMLRLSKSDRAYQTMAQIMDACTVEGCGVSAYDMHIADYQYFLHRLRIVTYGKDYDLSTRCPYCGCYTEDTIDLLDFPLKEINLEELGKYIEFDLPVTKQHIRVRVQTPRMLDNIKVQLEDFKKRNPKVQLEYSLLFTVKSLIETIDYQKPNPLFVEDWIKKLPMRDTDYIIKAAEKINESFGLETDLDVNCNVCGLSYKGDFKITQNFFRARDDF